MHIEQNILENVRLAWPFKEEFELLLLSNWFKSEQIKRDKEYKQWLKEYHESLLH